MTYKSIIIDKRQRGGTETGEHQKVVQIHLSVDFCIEID